jgi:hypothetical protein
MIICPEINIQKIFMPLGQLGIYLLTLTISNWEERPLGLANFMKPLIAHIHRNSRALPVWSIMEGLMKGRRGRPT